MSKLSFTTLSQLSQLCVYAYVCMCIDVYISVRVCVGALSICSHVPAVSLRNFFYCPTDLIRIFAHQFTDGTGVSMIRFCIVRRV